MKLLLAASLAVALAAMRALVLRPAAPEPARSSAAGSSAAVPVGHPSAPPVAVVELSASEGRSIGYVQHPGTMHVAGAPRTDLNEATG